MLRAPCQPRPGVDFSEFWIGLNYMIVGAPGCYMLPEHLQAAPRDASGVWRIGSRRPGRMHAMSGTILRDMSEFDAYLAGWQKRGEQERVASAEAREHALTVARELARVLVNRHGARRVLLVGSLARGDFGPGSDIDLVAEGLADDAFFAIGAELEALAGGFRVDLVPLESATAAYRARVAEEGVALA
jgi:uncharacterized protein